MKKSIAAFACAFAAFLPFTGFGAATVGDPAPNFTLTDVQGKSHSLSDYKGKYVVLEWNNPDCPFVKKHYDSGNMPELQKSAEKKGVIWLTINSSAPGNQGSYAPADLAKWLKEKGAEPTAYLLDPNGKAGKEYGAATTPNMYVINAQGKLVYEGAIDSIASPDKSDITKATNYVKVALDESMAGKPVSNAITRPYGCNVKYSRD